MQTYAEIFRELMRLRGKKPKDLYTHSGVKRTAVYDVLKGRRTPQQETLERLAEYLGSTLPKVEAMRGQATDERPLLVNDEAARALNAFADELGKSPSAALLFAIDAARSLAGPEIGGMGGGHLPTAIIPPASGGPARFVGGDQPAAQEGQAARRNTRGRKG